MNTKHWTEDSADDFVHSVVGDFVRFLEKRMGDSISQGELARRLNVSEGRVSQVLNNPGNLSLKTMVQYSRAIGVKIAIVGYDDRDAGNNQGPVAAEIFTACWERLGSPRDFFDCEKTGVGAEGTYIRRPTDTHMHIPLQLTHTAVTPGDAMSTPMRFIETTNKALLTA